MYLLYPRLPLPVAEAVVLNRAVKSVEELLEESDIFHESVQFAPTGGNKVDENELRNLQRSVRECAEKFGYPGSASEDSARRFDAACGILLHQSMHLHPSEASHLESGGLRRHMGRAGPRSAGLANASTAPILDVRYA
jgi:hypothetical protein